VTVGVRIAGSDIAFPCDAGETVLDAAERAGYSIPYSCRKGVCSTCEGGLVDGSAEVGHEHVRGPRDNVLLCRAKPTTNITIAPKRIEKRDPVARKRVKATVYRLQNPTPDVTVLQLRFPAGTRAKFRAGQYLRLFMPDGDSRNFSMANPPHESDGVQLHVRRVAGGRFSESVLASLKTTDKLDIELPYGEFFLRDGTNRPIVLLATGTGFAPIKSMVEDMMKRGIRRPARLFWGARTEPDLYMPALLGRWAAQAEWLKLTLVLSEADGRWTGRTGLVHRAVLEDVPDLAGHQVYACGNPFMIDAARADFVQQANLAENEFYADPFVPTGDKETGA
jgi:NAD(P)H-flavin reductase/ferredoxin